MDFVKLYWQRRNVDEIRNNESPALYMFSRGRNIIYIDIAYRTGLKTEIDSNIKRLKLEKTGLSIWITKIAESNYKHVSEKLFSDTKGLLVFFHKISEYKNCNIDYDINIHRDDFKVFNYECSFLYPWVKVYNEGFYCRRNSF